MRVDLFDFDLPAHLIAERPAVPRDSARLLEVADTLRDCSVRDLPALLRPGDLLVFNDTRVIPARLFGQRGAGKIEVTLHKSVAAARWRAFARPARKLRPGDAILFGDGLSAAVTDKREGGEVELVFDRSGPELMAALARVGRMPLPPYIKRPGGADKRDRTDYQTIFAVKDGAVAAPTAGLHFTPALLAALEARDIARVAVTLHVGAGTFLPVKADDTKDHVMHAEAAEVGSSAVAAIERTRAAGGRIVAVGTTSLRLLETASDEDGGIRPFSGDTNLFITPGYRFKAVDLLLTNFHLPRSTLFMLVCAFAGLDRMKAAYEHAKAAGYRFYSYGDCCLLHPQKK
ncbi:MAG: tRNA preQ1(34) S-adenosylmethionine ribosyltransferase-isomerase QueA [Rhodospirillales bacterium]|nr:tRNA preQ1(34) S-adenosylmethionine ribosyltransferase-isomerase QueA [Rhodospirillales bacterium]